MKLKLITLSTLCYFACNAQKAFVIVPVAELIGEKAENLCVYDLPNSAENVPTDCPRFFQALYNNVVDVGEVSDSQAQIFIKNVIYHPEKKDFWTPITSLKMLPDEDLETLSKYLPEYNDNFVTLTEPFTYEEQTFSAGTQFVVKSQNSTSYTVTFLTDKLEVKEFDIEKNYVTLNKAENINKKVLFVTVLKKWADTTNGFVPLTWGGASFTERISNDTQYLKVDKDGKVIFNLPQFENKVKTGFDTSAMILRAAQIAGFDFIYRNTTMINANLRPLTTEESVENGDIVWFKGYSAVVTDAQKGLLVGARSYSSGYGRVHEESVERVFKDVNSLADLKEAYLNNRPLELLDKAGNVMREVSELRILRF